MPQQPATGRRKEGRAVLNDVEALTPDKLNGVEHIRDASDLPAPVNGVHPLENKVYHFVSHVQSDHGLELNDTSPLLGEHRSHCAFIHTGGGTAITGDGVDCITSDLTLDVPGGTVFDVSGGPDTNLMLNHTTVANNAELGSIANLGTLEGYPDAELRAVNFQDFDSGLTFAGDYNRVFVETNVKDVAADGVTVFHFDESFNGAVISVSNSDFQTVQPDTSIVRVDPNATVSEVLLYQGNGHDPTVSQENILTGKADPSISPYWVSSSFPLRNSAAIGEVSLSQETTTTIPAQNEWVRVSGPTTEGNETQRTTGDGQGGVEYTGRKVTNVQVNISVSWTGANGALYEFAIGKNGTPEPTSALPQAGGGQNSNQVTAVSGIEDLTPGDTISLMVRNTSGTSDLTLSRYVINFMGS